MNRVDVVCALIWKDKKWLAVGRSGKAAGRGEWELPGGKVEDGETPEEAIIREIREELGIRIRIIKRSLTIDHEDSFRKIRLIPFHCTWLEREIKLREHDRAIWLGWNEWKSLSWSQADEKLLIILMGMDPGKNKNIV